MRMPLQEITGAGNGDDDTRPPVDSDLSAEVTQMRFVCWE
jgi:hypothetical protein